MATAEPLSELAQMVMTSDEATLTMFQPEPATPAHDIETYIQNHPYVKHLRENTGFREARPHLKLPGNLRQHNLTAGTLTGDDKIMVPPVYFSCGQGREMVSIMYLGKSLCGHPGVIHGGMLATLLDEGLARCCFESLPSKMGMTANLNVNYRKPCMAEQFLVLKARTVKVEGRKAWVVGKLMTLESPEEWEKKQIDKELMNGHATNGATTNGEDDYDWGTGTVLVDAEGLFVEPKHAATIAKLWNPRNV